MGARIHGAIVSAAAVVLAGCAAAPVQPPAVETELDRILALLPGEYVGEADDPASPGARMVIVHRLALIDAPQIGRSVAYYQLNRDWGGGPVLQQKLFVFDRDPERRANRMQPYLFTAAQTFQDLDRRPALWPRLTEQALDAFPPGCAFVWRAAADRVIGEVRREDCAFDSDRFDQPIRPDMRYEFSARGLVWSETLYSADGRPVVSTGGPLPARRQSPAP